VRKAGRCAMRDARSLINEFLLWDYVEDIGSKGRSTLLAEVEHVSCNLCGHDDTYTFAERDKYGLKINTVICRNCGLLYLSQCT
jgi:hypothetical protein